MTSCASRFGPFYVARPISPHLPPLRVRLLFSATLGQLFYRFARMADIGAPVSAEEVLNVIRQKRGHPNPADVPSFVKHGPSGRQWTLGDVGGEDVPPEQVVVQPAIPVDVMQLPRMTPALRKDIATAAVNEALRAMDENARARRADADMPLVPPPHIPPKPRAPKLPPKPRSAPALPPKPRAPKLPPKPRSAPPIPAKPRAPKLPPKPRAPKAPAGKAPVHPRAKRTSNIPEKFSPQGPAKHKGPKRKTTYAVEGCGEPVHIYVQCSHCGKTHYRNFTCTTS